MSSTQWRDGLVNVVNASQTIIGTASCDWANQITTSHRFKVDRDGESTYQVGQVVSATRMILNANYAGDTGTGLSYMANRSYTISRGYWRCLQGDFDFAEILSQDTIDKIDTDINNIITGNASIGGTKTKVFKINYNGSAARLHASWLTASRDYTFPDQNATLAGLSVAQTFSADQTIDANLWVTGNASIDGTLDVTGETTLGDRAIVTGTLWSKNNASIDGRVWVTGNASVDGTLDVTGETTIDDRAIVTGTLWNKYNASIDGDLAVGGNISGDTYGSDSSVSDAELLYIGTLTSNAQTQLTTNVTNITRANASIDTLQDNVINANASIAYLKEEFIPVEWGRNASFPPDTAEDIMQSYQTVVVRKFNNASWDEKLSFVLRAPNGIQSTTVRYSPHMIITATPPAGGQGVVFGLSGHSKAIGASYGSEVLASKIDMTATLNPRYSQVQVGWSSAVTLASLEGGRLAFLELVRRQSHTDDDYDRKAGIPGFDIRWI